MTCRGNTSGAGIDWRAEKAMSVSRFESGLGTANSCLEYRCTSDVGRKGSEIVSESRISNSLFFCIRNAELIFSWDHCRDCQSDVVAQLFARQTALLMVNIICFSLNTKSHINKHFRSGLSLHTLRNDCSLRQGITCGF
jgi:hypothetical protein